jgi:acyl-CoA dehydrogenase
MAEEGLMGLLLPAACGGYGGSHLSAVAVVETLAAEGGNMGIALSLAVHLLVSRLISEFSQSGPAGVSLEKLARGETTVSLAVSEPGLGAHPKHLRTTARYADGSYILHGEKSYLTNGPIADQFLVFAVTAVEGERKRFGAFIVPKGAEGLSISEPMDFGFLRPSPHCTIKLENCRVPEANVLGEPGTAYETMAVPFREHEDVYLMGMICGGFKWCLEMLLGTVRGKVEGVKRDGKLLEALGETDSLIKSLDLITHEAASLLDHGAPSLVLQQSYSAFRSSAKHTLSIIEGIVAACALEPHPGLAVATNDLRRSLNIAQAIIRFKQRRIGEMLLSGKAPQ